MYDNYELSDFGIIEYVTDAKQVKRVFLCWIKSIIDPAVNENIVLNELWSMFTKIVGLEAMQTGLEADIDYIKTILEKRPNISNCNTPGYVEWNKQVEEFLRYDE